MGRDNFALAPTKHSEPSTLFQGITVFSPRSPGQVRFHRVNAPTSEELNALGAMISEPVARYLERQGWLVRDEQRDHLDLAVDEEEGATLKQLQGHYNPSMCGAAVLLL